MLGLFCAVLRQLHFLAYALARHGVDAAAIANDIPSDRCAGRLCRVRTHAAAGAASFNRAVKALGAALAGPAPLRLCDRGAGDPSTSSGCARQERLCRGRGVRRSSPCCWLARRARVRRVRPAERRRTARARCPTIQATMPAHDRPAARHSLFDDAQALLTGTLFISLGVALYKHAGLLHRRHRRPRLPAPLRDRARLRQAVLPRSTCRSTGSPGRAWGGASRSRPSPPWPCFRR